MTLLTESFLEKTSMSESVIGLLIALAMLGAVDHAQLDFELLARSGSLENFLHETEFELNSSSVLI